MELISQCWPVRAMVRPEWGEDGTVEIVAELHRSGAIIAYSVGTELVVQINKFHDHQTLRWGFDSKGYRKGGGASKYPNGFGDADDKEEPDLWYASAIPPKEPFGECVRAENGKFARDSTQKTANPSRKPDFPRTADSEVEVGSRKTNTSEDRVAVVEEASTEDREYARIRRALHAVYERAGFHIWVPNAVADRSIREAARKGYCEPYPGEALEAELQRMYDMVTPWMKGRSPGAEYILDRIGQEWGKGGDSNGDSMPEEEREFWREANERLERKLAEEER